MAHLDKRVCICYLFKGITEDSVEDDEGAGTYHTPQHVGHHRQLRVQRRNLRE